MLHWSLCITSFLFVFVVKELSTSILIQIFSKRQPWFWKNDILNQNFQILLTFFKFIKSLSWASKNGTNMSSQLSKASLRNVPNNFLKTIKKMLVPMNCVLVNIYLKLIESELIIHWWWFYWSFQNIFYFFCKMILRYHRVNTRLKVVFFFSILLPIFFLVRLTRKWL